MSLAEREPYEEMARQYNKDPNMRGGKLASDGTRVEVSLFKFFMVKIKPSSYRLFILLRNEKVS